MVAPHQGGEYQGGVTREASRWPVLTQSDQRDARFRPGSSRGLTLSNDEIIRPWMNRNRFPPVLACRRFWRFQRDSGPMPSGMSSMSSRSCWLPEIDRERRSRTSGGTTLHPAVIPNPAAGNTTARDRGGSSTRGHPSAMRRKRAPGREPDRGACGLFRL